MTEKIEDQEIQKPDKEAMAAKYGQNYIESDSNVTFDVQKFEMKNDNYDTEDVRFVLSALIKFISSPIITDNFKDHSERKKFRNEIFETDPEYYAVVETSRLRENNISNVELMFSILENCIDDSNMPEIIKERIKQLCDELPKHSSNSYDSMTNEERIDHVKQIDAVITKLFNILSSVNHS